MDELVAYDFQSKPRTAARCYWAHANHLYSVAAVTDAFGKLQERSGYDAYGKQSLTNSVGAARTTSAVGNQTAFTGRPVDGETGLMYFRARMYVIVSGRFVSYDPWKRKSLKPQSRDGYKDGWNAYQSYMIPDFLDPNGTGCCSWGNCSGMPEKANCHRSGPNDLIAPNQSGWADMTHLPRYKTCSFECYDLNTAIQPNGWNAEIKISTHFTKRYSGSDCKPCSMVVSKQWVNPGAGWQIDNRRTRSDFYNYDSGVNSPPGQKTVWLFDDEPGDLGGNGVLIDSPTYIVRYDRMVKEWTSCFYCMDSFCPSQTGSQPKLIGCVRWKRNWPNGIDEAPVYTIGECFEGGVNDAKYLPSDVPGITSPVGNR